MAAALSAGTSCENLSRPAIRSPATAALRHVWRTPALSRATSWTPTALETPAGDTTPSSTSPRCRGRDGPRPRSLSTSTSSVRQTCLEAALEAGIDKVVFASSGAATGFSFQKHALRPTLSATRRGASLRAAGRIWTQQAAGRADLQTLQRRVRHPHHLPAHQQQLVPSNAPAPKWRSAPAGRSSSTSKICGPPATAKRSRTRRATGRRRARQRPTRSCGPSPTRATRHRRFASRSRTTRTRHEVFLINGDDTCSREPTAELIARHYPGVPLKAPLEGHATAWSHERATRAAGLPAQIHLAPKRLPHLVGATTMTERKT